LRKVNRGGVRGKGKGKRLVRIINAPGKEKRAREVSPLPAMVGLKVRRREEEKRKREPSFFWGKKSMSARAYGNSLKRK